MRLFAILGVLVALCLPAAAETVRLGDRWYRIELPPDPEGAPLILALHGGGATPTSSPTPRDLPARPTGQASLSCSRREAVGGVSGF